MAILLLRERADLKVLVLEKNVAFGRKVGEATVEISAYFLGRVLGLTQHLNESHLVKQGMRFWFFNERTQTLQDCSEIGGRYLARVPAYQIDRSVLDEEILRRAQAAGAQVWRPASVTKVQLESGGQQNVQVQYQGASKQIRARWVVDASGVAALLARQHGWFRQNTDHPTTAVWARWTGVKDWDGCELASRFPDFAMACHGIRATATNHFVGPGWWAWCIPLKGGDVSIGVVFDQRLVKWPAEGPLGERLKSFLMQHPVAREIMTSAQWREGDVHWRKNLPYYSTKMAGDGFALVGDAAGFIDPFYSPGMDWVAFTCMTTSVIIGASLRGDENVSKLLEKHNRDFTRSYQRWFQAVYRDKYEYMGDFELMRLAFVMDLGLYYIGVAAQPFKRGLIGLCEPIFSTPRSVPFFHLMNTYNRRFAKMARARRRRNRYGLHNQSERFMVKGFTFEASSSWPVFSALARWGLLELKEGWRSWFETGLMEKENSASPVASPSYSPSSMTPRM